MKSLIVIGSFGLALSSVACSGSGSSASSESGVSSADRLVLDVRCASNADCPATFECEHGASTSFCKSQDTIGSASSPACPAGTEPELEHGTTFCRAPGASTSSGTASGSALDDDAGAGSSTSGGAAAGATCVTSADCASGLQCEVQVEHGVSSSTCKASGKK